LTSSPGPPPTFHLTRPPPRLSPPPPVPKKFLKLMAMSPFKKEMKLKKEVTVKKYCSQDNVHKKTRKIFVLFKELDKKSVAKKLNDFKSKHKALLQSTKRKIMKSKNWTDKQLCFL
jgi:hypothetical protein